MTRILTYSDIDPQQWQSLVERSPYATWFQTPEAYRFYAANPEEMMPFVYAVAEEAKGTMDEAKGKRLEARGTENGEADIQASRLIASSPNRLKAVCVGYITKERSALKQFFTRRAIIIGGPLLAEDASDAEVAALLKAVKECKVESLKCKGTEDEVKGERLEAKGEENGEADTPASTPYTLHSTPIYIETRNFHDYSKWRHVFEQCGFAYQPHLNFHVDTSSVEVVDKNLGKSRKRDIRTTIRDGVTPVLNPTIEQVREYYAILKDLYTTKVKTPLFSWHFFEQLYHTAHGRFILTEYQGKIIGGTVCVVLPNKAVYEWFVCGADGVYEHIFPSSYATYLGIRYAAENGCQIFDMMGAGKPEEAYGVRDFKARFGGEQVEHGRYLCVRKPLLYWIGKLGVKLLKKR